MLVLDSNLKKRLFTIVIGAPIVVGIIYTGGIVLKSALAVTMLIALYEWFSMAKKASRPIMVSFCGLIYVVTGFVSIGMIDDFWVLLFLFLCVWSSDILAYIFGKTFGGPKMSPTISPNKTWSGYVGAIISPFVLSLLFFEDAFTYLTNQYQGHFHDTYFVVMYFDPMILLMACIGIVGQSGDLMVSALKRHVNVKDTGALFPGHGGVLDRIDALLLVAPFYLAVYTIINQHLSILYTGAP